MNEQTFQLLLELAFVTYVTKEYHDDPDFPDLNRVTALVEKMTNSPHATENITAKDMLVAIMRKYGV